MFKIDLITIFAIFGALQSFMFALFFWSKNKHLSNKVFAILLLVTGIRIAKNIVVHLSELNPEFNWNSRLVGTIVFIGIAHQFAIGPLYLLYFFLKSNQAYVFKKEYFLHFLPYIVILMLCPFIQWNFWANGGLLLSYVSILFYYIFSIRIFFKYSKDLDSKEALWLRALLIITLILIVAYSPALFKYLGYIGGAVLYSIMTIVMSYSVLSNKDNIHIFSKKYSSSTINKSKTESIKLKLESGIRSKKYYLDPNLTLKVLAASIDVPPNQLSQVINKEIGKSYTEYINSFRLIEVVKKLEDSNLNNIKIASLAFDSGFNSQPTFNTLFKKKYGITPSQFRKNTSRKFKF